MDFVQTYVSELCSFGVGVAWTFTAFLLIESLLPRIGAAVTTQSRIKGVGFWLVYGAIITAIAHILTTAWSSLGLKPLLPHLAPPWLPAPLGAVIAVVAAAFIGDFFYYWCHRAQHRFFWRYHAVHHSVRELSGVTAYHHFSEQVFEFCLYLAPMSLFIDSPFNIPIVGVLLSQQGNYLHSPTRLNLGPLGRYFVDNRLHRIHHSREPRHFDKNFALFTTLWDVVFGTAYFPAPGEWPETGVDDFPEPATVREFITAPWRSARPAPK